MVGVMRYFSESGEYQRETATGVPSGWRAGANARRLLAALPVASEPPRVGYDRDLFPHWDDTDHDGCDTRCEVLAAERAERRHLVLVVGRQARSRVGSPRHRSRRRARRGMGLRRLGSGTRREARCVRRLAGQPRRRRSEDRRGQGRPGRRRMGSAAIEVGVSVRRDHDHDEVPLGPVGGRRREGHARRAAQRLHSHDVQSTAGHRTAQAAAEGDPLRRFALHGDRQRSSAGSCRRAGTGPSTVVWGGDRTL